MTMHASGTFEVKLSVQKADNTAAESAKLGRMSMRNNSTGTWKGRAQARC